MKNIFNLVFALILLSGIFGTSVVSAQPDNVNEVQKIVREYLKEKTKHTGTLDIYDTELNAVRNLRTMKVYDGILEKNGSHIMQFDYRDIKRGSVVTVDIIIGSSEGSLAVKELRISKVKELNSAANATDVKTDFTDAEIQDRMNKYIEGQAKFTGALTLFDGEKQKLRQLKLIGFSEEVRRMGILYISRGTFEDVESGE